MTTTSAGPRPDTLDDLQIERHSDASERRGAWSRLTAHPNAMVGLTSFVAGVWAFVGSRLVFPFLTNNHDEAVYLLQANALEHGHLFPKASADPAAFLPWLTTLEGHHFIPKYAPVFPAMLAFGKLVFTTERASLALIAAGIIVATYLLGIEVLDDRRTAALASVVMLATPLFIVQTATFLPYAFELLLLLLFAFMLLRGLRTSRNGWLVGAGALLGLAFFARPYDALLFTLPFAVYAIVQSRRTLALLLQRLGWFVLGLLPPAVGMALFDHAATGSATKSPFSLLDSRDTIGFGNRSMDPNNPAVKYTPGLGWTGLSRHLMLSAFWCFGGLVLVGCAIYYLAQKRWRGRATWAGAVVVAVPLGYLFFWGTYGAAVWGAPWYLGPYYYMPIFGPIAILGAGGFVLFRREMRTVTTVALVGMLVLSGFVVGKAMVENWTFTRDDQRLNTALTNAHLHDALVFLPGFYGPRVLHPFASSRNSWDVSGDVIYAVDRGADLNAQVAADYPQRQAYILQTRGQYRASPSDTSLTSSLQPLSAHTGTTFDVVVDFKTPDDIRAVSVVVQIGNRSDVYVLDRAARPGAREHIEFTVTEQSTQPRGGRVLAHLASTIPFASQLHVEISGSPDTKTLPQAFYGLRIGYGRADGQLHALFPGDEVNGELSPEPVRVDVR